MRTLVIGDIHGSVTALKQVLEKAGHNLKKDRIICVGDYVDGWGDSFEVVELLLKIKKESKYPPVFILGNHDWWFKKLLNNFKSNFRDEKAIYKKEYQWLKKADGESTYLSYLKRTDEEINRHRVEFFNELLYYYEEDNKLFLHGGFDPEIGFSEMLEMDKGEFLWDRKLFLKALNTWEFLDGGLRPVPPIDKFDKIYIGHTPTVKYDIKKPVKMGNVINVDQGCKVGGRLSIWVDNTDEFFQSSEVKS